MSLTNYLHEQRHLAEQHMQTILSIGFGSTAWHILKREMVCLDANEPDKVAQWTEGKFCGIPIKLREELAPDAIVINHKVACI